MNKIVMKRCEEESFFQQKPLLNKKLCFFFVSKINTNNKVNIIETLKKQTNLQIVFFHL